MREAIKKIVFGLIYGKSVKTLCRDIYVASRRRAELEAKETLLLAELASLKKATA